MLTFEIVIKVLPIVVSVVAIFIALITFILQKTTFKKNFVENNLFDIDCKGILVSNIATSEDDTDNGVDENEKGETKRLPDGGYSVHVKDAMIIEFTLVFSTSGRCFLMDSDISEIYLENSFKKVKITGFISAKVVDNFNGFASHGFTLKTMNFQYLMPKQFFAADNDEFTRVIIESKKIKNGVAVFEARIRFKEFLQDLTHHGGIFINVLNKIS